MDEIFIQQHYEEIYQYIYFLVGKKELAQDLTQDTFVKMIRIKQDNPLTNQRAYVYKTARNTVYDAMKRAKIIKFLPFTQHDEQRANEYYEPEQWLMNDEENYVLYKALGALPFDYRQAIILRKIEQFSIKETAMMLDWSESKVKNATERGLKKLQQLMGGINDEEA